MRDAHHLHDLRGGSDVIFRSGTLSSFCVSCLRSASANTKHRYHGTYHAAVRPERVEGQAQRRLRAAPRTSCHLAKMSRFDFGRSDGTIVAANKFKIAV